MDHNQPMACGMCRDEGREYSFYVDKTRSPTGHGFCIRRSCQRSWQTKEQKAARKAERHAGRREEPRPPCYPPETPPPWHDGKKTRAEKAASAAEAEAELEDEVWMFNTVGNTQKVEELEDEDETYAWACGMMDAAEKVEEDEEAAREADLLYRNLKKEHEAKVKYDEEWEEDSWDREQWQYPGPAKKIILSYEQQA